MKVCINGQCHMTKMAAMARIAKTFKNIFLQNQKVYDFETLHEASGNEALQILLNHDPGMTLTNLRQDQLRLPIYLNGENR